MAGRGCNRKPKGDVYSRWPSNKLPLLPKMCPLPFSMSPCLKIEMTGEQTARFNKQRGPRSDKQRDPLLTSEGHKASLSLTWEFHYRLGAVCADNTALGLREPGRSGRGREEHGAWTTRVDGQPPASKPPPGLGLLSFLFCGSRKQAGVRQDE